MGGAYDVIDLGQGALSRGGGARFMELFLRCTFFVTQRKRDNVCWIILIHWRLFLLLQKLHTQISTYSPAAYTDCLLKLTLKWRGFDKVTEYTVSCSLLNFRIYCVTFTITKTQLNTERAHGEFLPTDPSLFSSLILSNNNNKYSYQKSIFLIMAEPLNHIYCAAANHRFSFWC